MEDVARRHGVADRIRTGTEVTRGELGVTGAGWSRRAAAATRRTCCSPRAGSCRRRACRRSPGSTTSPVRRFHTARWRHDVDLAGRRVAVVGTGCSAIQVVPAIQPHVAHVDVYQRSPGWTIPKLDFAYRERTKRLFARYPRLQRLDRQANFAFHEYGALGLTRHHWLMKPVQAVSRAADQPRDQRSGAAAQGHADRRDRLQADHAHRRLVSDAHEAERRPRHRPRRGRDRAGRRAPAATSGPPT